MDWAQIWEIVSLPDNIPIVAIAVAGAVLHVVRSAAGAGDRQAHRRSLKRNPEQAKTHHRKIHPFKPGWARELQVWPYLLRSGISGGGSCDPGSDGVVDHAQRAA